VSKDVTANVASMHHANGPSYAGVVTVPHKVCKRKPSEGHNRGHSSPHTKVIAAKIVVAIVAEPPKVVGHGVTHSTSHKWPAALDQRPQKKSPNFLSHASGFRNLISQVKRTFALGRQVRMCQPFAACVARSLLAAALRPLSCDLAGHGSTPEERSACSTSVWTARCRVQVFQELNRS